MSLQRISLGSIAVLLVAGCMSNDDEGGCNQSETNGLADNATFKYECSTAADPTCDPPNTEPPLPDAIALGARFRLSAGFDRIEPVSSKAVERSGWDFIALRTGDVGFVISAGAEAVDAVRLKVEAPVAITIAPPRSKESPTGLAALVVTAAPPIALAPSQSATVRAVAVRSENRPLAGTIPVEWSIDNLGVASFEVGADGACVVTAKAKGRAVLTATSGGLSTKVDIGVGEDAGPGDAGADASDGGAS